MIIHYYNTPIGYLKLHVSGKGVRAVEFAGVNVTEENEERRESYVDKQTLSVNTSNADTKAEEKAFACVKDTKAEEKILEKCIQWLDDYFAGTIDHVQSLPPLDIQHKSEFYHEVWRALMSTHPGETLSYAQLAVRSGHPGKARAIGQAISKHSIPILIPCHRVVKSGGKGIGNYSGGDGAPTKRWLLDHEKKMIKKK